LTTITEELVTGIVEHVGMYEREIGFRDRCVVFLQVDGHSRMFVFDADIRDHLPVGRRVQVRYRPSAEDGIVTLLDRKIL
jgi:hypothetical protein